MLRRFHNWLLHPDSPGPFLAFTLMAWGLSGFVFPHDVRVLLLIGYLTGVVSLGSIRSLQLHRAAKRAARQELPRFTVAADLPSDLHQIDPSAEPDVGMKVIVRHRGGDAFVLELGLNHALMTPAMMQMAMHIAADAIGNATGSRNAHLN